MDPRLDPDYLKPVSLLPAAFQSVFPFRYFNAVQSESFAEVFLSGDNLAISAPTGSGKTVLFELCILRLLEKSLTAEGVFCHASGSRKTVYIAPMKALVQDKFREWNQRFSSLGLKCQELTSDSGQINIQDMLDKDIILTTPEKFDVITRRHRDRGGMSLFGDIALVLIDEVHLLSESRGAALEAVVSRLKMLSRFPEIKGCPLSAIRFVAVSATVPNIEDLAEWLQVPQIGIKRFGEEYRPVKLATIVLGFPPAKNDFLFERRLQHPLFDILMQHSGGRPSLVFCSTRKGAQETALSLIPSVSNHGDQNPFVKNLEHFDRLRQAALRTTDVHMQQCIRCGVGYHNGGLSMQDRSLVEELFLKGDLFVLCTTSTLAQGVNLPAYAVIIKSTQYYNKTKSCYVEYERSAILQMSGRAGRPQFEDSGVVVIMTRNNSVHLYQNLLSGSEPVESQLLPSIVEHLNAEIVLMTVTDCSQAIDWLKCSYLYVRIKKNPQHYNIKKGVSPDQLENKLKDICVQNVNELAKYGLVKTDEFGFVLTPLEPGRIMEKYYLRFETMKAITKAPGRSTMEDFLHILTNAEELSCIKLRRDEKKRLNAINGDTSGRIRFHVNSPNGKLKKRIQSDQEKIFVLVNDALSGEPSVLDFTMNQDINGICSTGTRICWCMRDYFIFLKRYTEIRNALLLSKCLKQRLWETTKFQIKQLIGVGLVTAKLLVAGGVDSFEKLASSDPRRLEAITGRKFPYGDQLKTLLNDVPPKVEMNLFKNGGNDQCLLTLRRDLQPQFPGKSFHFAELIVGNKMDNSVLYRERIRMDEFASPYTVTISCRSASNEPHVPVVAALISEEYVGFDVVCNLSINLETKDGTLGLSGGKEYLDHQTSETHFYGSCLLKTIRRTGASDAPVLEASCRHSSKSFDSSSAISPSRRFSSILNAGIKEAQSKETPPNPTRLEPHGTSEIELLATSPILLSESPSSSTFDHADSPEIVTSSHSSDIGDTSRRTSLVVPANTIGTSSCNSPTVCPRTELLPRRFLPRRLFRRLRPSNEETQTETFPNLINYEGRQLCRVSSPPNVSQLTPPSVEEHLCINNAGVSENYAYRNTTSCSRNFCGAENLTEASTPLLDEKHMTKHDNVELQTASLITIDNQYSGPSVSIPAASSLTSQIAKPDLLSSDLRRKIRRTGFSSILIFPSVDENVQGNSMSTMNRVNQISESRLLLPDGNGEAHKTTHGPRVLLPSPTLSGCITNTNSSSPTMNKDPDLLDFRGTAYSFDASSATEAEYLGRSTDEKLSEETDLIMLERTPSPCKEKKLWSSIKDKFAAKTDRSTSEQVNSRILNRSETSSSSQIENPSIAVSSHREFQSFRSGFARNSASNVSRLKSDDSRTKSIGETSNHASFKEDFRSYGLDDALVVRPTSAEFGGSKTVQASPAGKQEFMGYKSLFSFL